MLARLIDADVQLVTALDPELGRTQADPSQLEQVVVNLAVNARDAMPHGGRLLIETANADLDDEFVSRHAGSRPGSYVSLTIADTGEGMDPETIAHVFEPFFTTKGPSKGTGLGLSIIYGIAKENGGAVTFATAPNEGTTFEVLFPLCIAD
jgi:signal transduction histidine kinase